ncbi:hypothetical protein Axy22_076 [Achromobacter phage vB_AxyP_19-32_Axy22]|nr:hypothetical protein Axy22_076 [Achromobacter phage vB_AxyP_19-32_Axy22]
MLLIEGIPLTPIILEPYKLLNIPGLFSGNPAFTYLVPLEHFQVWRTRKVNYLIYAPEGWRG